jgi:hypothetical protein
VQFTVDFLSGVQHLRGVIDRVPPDTTTVFICLRLLVDPLSLHFGLEVLLFGCARPFKVQIARDVISQWCNYYGVVMASKSRTTTAIPFSDALHERLKEAADERDLSINFLVVKAVEDFLERMVPPEEFRLTRAS